MVRSGSAASVTLSGVGGDIPARDNIFAFNQIYGGRVGMVDTEHVLIAGNYVEGGLGDKAPVLQLRGKSEGARISLNHLVRPPGSLPGKTLNISSRALIFTLRGVDHTTGTLIVPAHGRDTGTGPVTLTTTGTLPAGLTPATDFWLIRVDARTLKLATSQANATAGTAVTFTDDGTGVHTVNFPPSVTLKGFDHTTGTLIVPAHGRDTGTGPVTLTTTGTLPAGLTPATDFWLIRVDADTLKLATSQANATAGTAVTFADNGAGRHELDLVDHPSGIDVSQNRLHSHSGADNTGCTVLITNAQQCSFTENEVASYAGTAVPTAIRFTTSAAIRTSVGDWSICQNRILGNAGHDGAYDDGITVAPIGVPVRGVSLVGNTFRGCTNQIRWSVGSYADTPTAYGNLGDGNDFAELDNLSAVCIGGSPASQADYIYSADGEPTFNAADGSTARRRTGGTPGATIYFREASGWVAK
jgi:plastocyanin